VIALAAMRRRLHLAQQRVHLGRRQAAAGAHARMAGQRAADLLDPPYREDLAAPALAALAAARWFAPDALAIVEVAARQKLVPPPGFTLLEERRYGAARLVFLRYRERGLRPA